MMMKVLVTFALLPSFVVGSNCHGMSRFRLAAAHPKSSTPTGKMAAREATLLEKDILCEVEYGKGALLMDLEKMEGEFKNPSDLQHALNPLFADDRANTVYYISLHGSDRDHAQNRYVLKFEGNATGVNGTRVAGPVFLEHQTAEDDYEAEVLCYIPKPKYSSTSMTMNGGKYHSVQEKGSSWAVPLLSMVAVAALGLAAFQSYRAKQALQASNTIGRPTLDLGGSYSMLSSSENELTEQLAPSRSTELV